MRLNTIVFDGYIAQVLNVFAERKGMSPQDYVLSLFDGRCNAPGTKSPTSRRVKISHRVQCTQGNYEPVNCRWATAKQQAVNRRHPKHYRKRGRKEGE